VSRPNTHTDTTLAGGWYPDPDAPGQQRWWDGAQWTEHTQPAPPAPAPQGARALPVAPASDGHDPRAKAEAVGAEKAGRALLLSILGMLLFPPLAVVAVVMGRRARQQAKRTGRPVAGKMDAAFITGIVACSLWALIAVAVLADSGGSSSKTSKAAASSPTPAATAEQQQRTPEPTPAQADTPTPEPTPTAPVAPPVRLLRGTGAQVKTLTLSGEGPLVVSARHTGGENFIVHLVGRGAASGINEGLFNEIGTYKGQALVEEVTAGRYRVTVRADGPWTLRFAQPVPGDSAVTLPGTLRGTGAKVLPVAVSTDDFLPVVTATHRGEENFIVHLVGYGDETSGWWQGLFNEIGGYKGETLVEEPMPAGGYLVAVQADGPWTLKFRD
jgi:hypothetical protein